MIEQWQALLSELQIDSEGEEIIEPEKLLRFESENDINLPTEYKEFCQIFGTGTFGGFTRIFCPNSDLSDYSRLTLESIRELTELFPSGNIQRDFRLKDLTNNGFVFGDDFGANVAVWDLRTYREEDQSYDIYWIDIDALDEDLYHAGRSFFEFTHNFCLNRGSYNFLPADKRLSAEDRVQTFTRLRASS